MWLLIYWPFPPVPSVGASPLAKAVSRQTNIQRLHSIPVGAGLPAMTASQPTNPQLTSPSLDTHSLTSIQKPRQQQPWNQKAQRNQNPMEHVRQRFIECGNQLHG
jgi:hypothetical protein